MHAVYEQDFYRWTQEQAEFLKTGNLSKIDVQHLAEEIESMGKSEKRELSSRLSVLLAHLLKWHFQPGLRSRSRQLTIKEQRGEITKLLAENPSLEATLPSSLADAHEVAVIAAERETGLPEEIFPRLCPYTVEQVTSADYMPD